MQLRRRFSDAPTLCTPLPAARCLEIDDLVAMVEGTLPPARAETVLSHVDRCAECAEVIANLGSLEGPDRRVGRYQIERLLGTGGMGIVYAAFDPELQRRVAVKLVRPDATNPALPTMMVKEARTLARLSHPNVVAVYDVGEHAGDVYFTTELIDGVTLADWQVGKTTQQIVGAWIQVARGLGAAHAEGVVHRDVKPSNVLVGHNGRARIGDFGIAYRGNTPSDRCTPIPTTDVVAGTPAYMAPEQKSGRVDARSDQFSTAIAMSEAITGTRAAAGDVLSLEPPELASVLTRALSFDPDMRFATMDEFADALARAIAPRAKKPSRAKWFVIPAAAAIIMAIAILRPVADPGCRIAEVPDGIWKARRDAFTKLPTDIAPVVERWLAKWYAASADVCRSELPLRKPRATCLARQLSQLRELLDGWETTPPRTAMTTFIALDDLPHAAWCSAENVALVGEPFVAIERRVARVLASVQIAKPEVAIQTLRDAIAYGPDDFSKISATIDMLSLFGADRVAEADALAATTRAQIVALGGDPALEAELDYRLGGVLASTDRRAEAMAAFERSHHGMRVAYGDDAPQVGLLLVSLAGEYYRRDGMTSKAAREAALAADAIWKKHRLQVPSILLPMTPDELIAKLEQLKAASLEQYGQGSEPDFDSEANLLDGYIIAEQLDVALAHGKRADAIARDLGLRQARVPGVRNQIAAVLLDLGRTAEAIDMLHDAIATAEQLGTQEELAFGRALLGRALVESGKPGEARAPLEASLKWMTQTNQTPRFRGRVRFWVAVVHDSVDEARVARAEVESFFSTVDADLEQNPTGAPHMRRETERFMTRIDRWLASHK